MFEESDQIPGLEETVDEETVSCVAPKKGPGDRIPKTVIRGLLYMKLGAKHVRKETKQSWRLD